MKILIRLDTRNVNLEKLQYNTIPYFMMMSEEQLTKDIKSVTPEDHGALKGSWKPVVSRNSLTVSNSRNYAYYVEKGTGIFRGGHRIFPKNASVFRANIGGETVYFRHHKGMPAHNMTKKGAEKFKKRIPNLFKLALLKTTV